VHIRQLREETFELLMAAMKGEDGKRVCRPWLPLLVFEFGTEDAARGVLRHYGYDDREIAQWGGVTPCDLTQRYARFFAIHFGVLTTVVSSR
jgi:hypothetical protein